MTCKMHKGYVRVKFYKSEIREFKEKWPGSGLPNDHVSFILDSKNGDIVNIFPVHLQVKAHSSEAVGILHVAARKFAAQELNNPNIYGGNGHDR